MPTTSMSTVRKTRWTVVSSDDGGAFAPVMNGLSGCIPALISSVEWSSGGGTSEAEGSRVWPFDSK
jgi:hypothetical protein